MHNPKKHRILRPSLKKRIKRFLQSSKGTPPQIGGAINKIFPRELS
jgi:hypothetical protein